MASWRRAPLIVLVVFVISSGGGCGVRQDEFDCSNAVSHLAQCCSGFDPSTISCTYQDHGCTATSPALDVVESDCIRAKSCDDLQRGGACTRAMAADYSGATSICNAYLPPAPTQAGPQPEPPFGWTSSSSGAPANDDGAASDDSGQQVSPSQTEAGSDDGDASSSEAGEAAAPEGGDAGDSDAAE